MGCCGGFKVCVLLLVCYGEFLTVVETTPVVDDNDNKGFRYEEYLIEHEISSMQAKKALMAMNFTKGKVLYQFFPFLIVFEYFHYLVSFLEIIL